MLEIAELCASKLATLVLSFKSQILTTALSVPVPRIKPSGCNWQQVKPGKQEEVMLYGVEGLKKGGVYRFTMGYVG